MNSFIYRFIHSVRTPAPTLTRTCARISSCACASTCGRSCVCACAFECACSCAYRCGVWLCVCVSDWCGCDLVSACAFACACACEFRMCLNHFPFSHCTHCNTLQHTATHCNTLQHTAKYCNTLQHMCLNRINFSQHTHTHTTHTLIQSFRVDLSLCFSLARSPVLVRSLHTQLEKSQHHEHAAKTKPTLQQEQQADPKSRMFMSFLLPFCCSTLRICICKYIHIYIYIYIYIYMLQCIAVCCRVLQQKGSK